ncbi:MAG: hypothetical protein GX801_11730 [Fibrobacter sp.]|nr:hypothetical protein [Fibrobacter sp.]
MHKLSILFLALMIGLGQAIAYDFDDSESYGGIFDDEEYSSTESSNDSEDSYSTEDSYTAEETYSTEASYSSEEPSSTTIEASASQWDNLSYEELGLSQWEFQQVKKSNLTRSKLLSLLEIGVRPAEYLQKPWEQLGVSEDQWLNERSKGLEDTDIDRSYRNNANNQSYAYLSLLVPSLYQWKVDKKAEAISMNVIWGLSVGATVYLGLTSKNKEYFYTIPVIAAVHIWSFANGLLETQWETNPDANRFSWGVAPNFDGGWAGICQWRF